MSKQTEKIELTDLGYSDFFEREREDRGLMEYSMARVIAEYKEIYRVKSANGEYLAKVTGKQMFNAVRREDYPAVGDWVAITELEAGKAVIHAIVPRQTILKKKYNNKQDIQIIATNVDVSFIVESLDRDFSLNRFERYFVLAQDGNVTPAIILNKIDLISEAELNERINLIKNRFNNIDVILTSAITEQGLNELLTYIIPRKTYCFLGSSGVGKSSLINKLLKTNEIETKEVSSSTGRGQHTTTAREMYFLENGGIVIDNPGTRGVGIADADAGIEEVFDEITFLSGTCKYADCTHVHEPGCAVLHALENKELDEDTYQNYIKLKKENEHYEMTNPEKREKDRKFGKFIKKTLDQLKEFES